LRFVVFLTLIELRHIAVDARIAVFSMRYQMARRLRNVLRNIGRRKGIPQ
jgi:hypothetical protein